MRITDILKSSEITVSCELFPPKKECDLDNYRRTAAEVSKLDPSFISVTYGASGGTSDFTVDLADGIQNGSGVTALAHLTCASSDKDKIHSVLDGLKAHGIENVLALRGDIIPGTTILDDRFHHADELVKEIKSYGDFCIGGACYPEKHPEADTLSEDIENLKYKVDAGCEFLTTQMFFDNDILYRYIYRLAKAGIDVPVIAGIMPVTQKSQINRICTLSGSTLPKKFLDAADRFGSDPVSMKNAGILYASQQIVELISNGVNNIHIYTMNKPDIAAAIMANIDSVIGGRR